MATFFVGRVVKFINFAIAENFRLLFAGIQAIMGRFQAIICRNSGAYGSVSDLKIIKLTYFFLILYIMKKSVIQCMLLAAGVCAFAGDAGAENLTLRPDNIDDIIQALTLDEKIDLIVGVGGNEKSDATATVGNSSRHVPGAAGESNAVPRLGIPSMVLADGPAGLRISPLREKDARTYYCTHFPVEMALSSSWNKDLVESVGESMGDEVKRYGVDILLAPATNIYRNPLNGRNFEYYSEDPFLAGWICASMINGVQKNGVGTSLKHFAANNQETNRANNNVVVSPRALREIYLKPFEIAVKESQPWTVMTSYNKINGTMSSERADLITDILRKEWGFEGMVMTDWFGGKDACAQMQAGNDMLQPGKLQQRQEIKNAVMNGQLSRDLIDRNVRKILECIVKTPGYKGYIAVNNPDLKAHAAVTRNAANEGMVLLKNLKNTLPLNDDVKDVAVFGCTSYDFIAGGTGSGDVNHAYVVSLIEGLDNANLNIDKNVSDAYTAYISVAKEQLANTDNPLSPFLPQPRIAEMDLSGLDLKNVAKENDIALVTIGRSSGEFIDRSLATNYHLTDAEQKMISEVCDNFHRAGKKVVVVLNVCGVIETDSWMSKPDAVLVAWLPGQEGGNSVADILTGKENPSGRLPMTWPVKFEDMASSANFPIIDNMPQEVVDNPILGSLSDAPELADLPNFATTNYDEGIYVGYRQFTTKDIPVSFPFGYGLSYTTFGYDNLNVSKAANGDINVTVRVKNKGKRAGKEVVQVYVGAPGKDIDKPARELKAFAKTKVLAPGETEIVTLTIPYAELASFNEATDSWQVEEGDYQIMVAQNASDKKPLTAVVNQVGSITEKVFPALYPEQK